VGEFLSQLLLAQPSQSVRPPASQRSLREGLAGPRKLGQPVGWQQKKRWRGREQRKAAPAVKTRDQTSSEEGSSPSEDESEGGSEEGKSEGVESGVEESDGESGKGLGESEGKDEHSENSDDVPLPGWRK